MAAAGGGFENARVVDERKEQTRISRTEVLGQVPLFGGFVNHLELREWRLSGSQASGSLASPQPWYLTLPGCVGVDVSLWNARKFLGIFCLLDALAGSSCSYSFQ